MTDITSLFDFNSAPSLQILRQSCINKGVSFVLVEDCYMENDTILYETAVDSLNRAYKLADNPFIKNIMLEQISSLHDAIGKILNIGKKEL